MFEELMATLINMGPIGFFFASIIANASIILPIPIDLAVFVFAPVYASTGNVLGPLILGVIVGTGASIGELSGYFLGLVGMKSYEKMKKSEIDNIHKLKEKISDKGIPIIAFFAFTPLPFDAVGIAAGLIKYPMKKFFVGCWIGKVPRYIIIAYAGYYGIPWVIKFFGG